MYKIFEQSFVMTDSLHEGTEYFCDPYRYSMRLGNNEVVIDYNKNYEPLSLTIDGVQQVCNSYSEYCDDPRWFLKHSNLQDLSKFGLQGQGYVVKNNSKQIVIKVDNENQFTHYVFNSKKTKFNEIENERCVFTLKDLVIPIRKPAFNFEDFHLFNSKIDNGGTIKIESNYLLKYILIVSGSIVLLKIFNIIEFIWIVKILVGLLVMISAIAFLATVVVSLFMAIRFFSTKFKLFIYEQNERKNGKNQSPND